jgi:hypothetical protein
MKKLIFAVAMLCSLSAYCQTAKFTYQYHNQIAKGGTFTFTDPAGNLTFSAPADAGYLGGSDNPYFQLTKNVGPLPSGTWEIYKLKDTANSIFRLRPTSDVNVFDKSGKQIRDGFLIHGKGVGKSADQSSTGCIILEPSYRSKLKSAFNKYGVIKLIVTNIVTGDDNTTAFSAPKKASLKDKMRASRSPQHV